MKEKNKGITLVALVVTIIILLILVAIAINLSVGNNGLFVRTQEGAKQYEIEDYRETLELLRTDSEMERAYKNINSKEYMDIYEGTAKKEEKLQEARVVRKDDNKVRVITKEGYVFDVTEDEIKYIGIQGENPPPPALKESDIDVTLSPEGPTNQNVGVKVKPKIEGYKLQYLKDGEKWEDYIDEIIAKENGDIYVRLTNEFDEIGGSVAIVISNIDRQAPTVSHTTNPPSSTKAESITIDINATDESGINSVKNITTSNISKVNNTKYTVTKNGTYIFEIEDGAKNKKQYSVSISNVGTPTSLEVFSYMRNNNKTPAELGFTAEWNNVQTSELSSDCFLAKHTTGYAEYSASWSINWASLQKLNFAVLDKVVASIWFWGDGTTSPSARVCAECSDGTVASEWCSLESLLGKSGGITGSVTLTGLKGKRITRIRIDAKGVDPDYGGSEVRLTGLTFTGLK